MPPRAASGNASGARSGRRTFKRITEDTPLMTMTLEGSCRCGKVRFIVESHAPEPYQLCYCSICRKTDGGGVSPSTWPPTPRPFRSRARITSVSPRRNPTGRRACEQSTGERNFCTGCGAALWLYDPGWPELVHPFASAVDTPLPVPPAKTHLMLKFKPGWVEPNVGPGDLTFDLYPKESIEDWHKRHHVWVD